MKEDVDEDIEVIIEWRLGLLGVILETTWRWLLS